MKKIFILLALSIFFLFSCGQKQEVETKKGEEQSTQVAETQNQEAQTQETPTPETKPVSQEPIVRDKDPIVVMETNYGIIELELFWKETPKTAENMLRLVNSGFYDGLTFHRIVPNFVIQGGDPSGDGSGGPGYSIPFEKANTKHLRGSLGMARSQDPNSAGSQFYICLRDLPNLDNNYVVFGKVVKGMDVVDKIAAVKTGQGDFPLEKVEMTKVYEKK
ncbi:MAG TPA: peptidylprolyl isomerase [candidate division Zixibacteria bacterium]